MSIKINGKRLSAGKKQHFNGIDITKILFNGNEVWKYDVEPHAVPLSGGNVNVTYRYAEPIFGGIPSDTGASTSYPYWGVSIYCIAYAGWGAGVEVGASVRAAGTIDLTVVPNYEDISRVVWNGWWSSGTIIVDENTDLSKIPFNDGGWGSWSNSYWSGPGPHYLDWSGNAGIKSVSYYFA